jgi:hypothetical protein
MCFCASKLLREDRGLAPADRLRRRKAILMHDAEVSLRLVFHVAWRMALEAEQYLEKNADQHWDEPAGAANDRPAITRASSFSPSAKRHILQRSSRHHEIE